MPSTTSSANPATTSTSPTLTTSGRNGSGTGTTSPSHDSAVPSPAISCRASVPDEIARIGTRAWYAATIDTGIAPFAATTTAFDNKPSVTSGTPKTRAFPKQNSNASVAETASPTTYDVDSSATPSSPSTAPPAWAKTAKTTSDSRRTGSKASRRHEPPAASPSSTAPTSTTTARLTPLVSLLVFESLLVANRGEIARRVLRTAARLGVRTIAVYSEADADLPFVREADQAILLGPAPPKDSYLDIARVLEAAQRAGADAIHPGYGFLAENARFAQAVIDKGLAWVGPSPDAIEAMGDKINARNRMSAAGVPVAAGTPDPVPDVEDAVTAAKEIGYPVMVKAAAGGGGIGMGVARDEAELRKAYETARTRAERFFSSPSILLERYVENARHVEVQVLGLADGTVVALGERDCSVQRRHQKVAEETPSPGVADDLRQRMLAGAVTAAQAVGYRNAGTVECLVDPAAQEYVFLEMNTRLQVEHPVTELVTGVDLVEEQLRIAAGDEPRPDLGTITPHGHAIELRVYAEDPKRFLPSPGTITTWIEPSGDGIRIDAGYTSGNVVTPNYDPLLAKLCAYAADRDEAIERARAAVAGFTIEGLKTNLPFFTELLADPRFVSGDYDTGLVDKMRS
ncbi:MAG: acetyl-CoA carboxylase, biotin carboxylase subunit [Frankiaceae bacterium]|nr:acetyl-CoA carboxylase, biotin carboxylase subunit [Frankiaceae bacterium]